MGREVGQVKKETRSGLPWPGPMTLGLQGLLEHFLPSPQCFLRPLEGTLEDIKISVKVKDKQEHPRDLSIGGAHQTSIIGSGRDENSPHPNWESHVHSGFEICALLYPFGPTY